MKLQVCATGVLVVAASFLVVAPPSVALPDTERALIRAVVQATSPPEHCVDAEAERLEAGVDAIIARLGEGRPTVRRARRLHQLLHGEYLRVYDRDADTLTQILDEGAFNCLSASLLYGLVARSLGYEARAHSVPGHLLVRLQAGDRVIDVETTLPAGFDARGNRPHDSTRGQPEREASVGRAPSAADPASAGLSMPLEAAVGFAWLNRSWHDLDLGRPLEAALSVQRALTLLPAEADQVDGARMLLARAFNVEYDTGAFDSAFQIAAVDARLFPDRTTARDRLMAAAMKRIELRCEADEPRSALAVIDAVGDALPDSAEFVRLERRAYPGIAAAAVRQADWELADAVADRYASAQPDAQESALLSDWIDARRNSTPRSGLAVEADVPPVILY